jgi:hypothetical protein
MSPALSPPRTDVPVDPVLAALARIEGRLDDLEARLRPGLDVVAEAENAVAIAIDVADDVAARVGDVEDRLKGALALLERISAPETLAQLASAVDMAEQLPGLVATGIDIADATFDRARAAGVDLGRLVPALEGLAFFWGRTLTSETTAALTTAPQTAALMKAATTALQAATSAPPTSLSAFGAFRALSEPAVQRSLGVLVSFARAFGAALPKTQQQQLSPPRSSSSSSSSSSGS